MKKNVRMLTESAVMIALAAVLSLVVVYGLPNGGSVTAASMVPIVFIALRYRPSWALLTSVTYSGVQMLLGFYPPPTRTFFMFVLVVLLDYVFAFGSLGLAGLFAKPFRNRQIGAAFATAVVVTLRFLCHFVSGMIVWGVYADGQPVWLYSLTVNGSYMLPELIVSTMVVLFMYRLVDYGISKPAEH